MIADHERIALFNSPTRAMKAERLLRKAGIPCRMIPAPREVAEGCALALRFAGSEQEVVFAELTAANLTPKRLYGKKQGVLVGLPLPKEDSTTADSR